VSSILPLAVKVPRAGSKYKTSGGRCHPRECQLVTVKSLIFILLSTTVVFVYLLPSMEDRKAIFKVVREFGERVVKSAKSASASLA